MPRKAKNAIYPPVHKMALDTLSGVLNEMARVYRGAQNGKIPTDEAGRFIFMLREIRVVVEAKAAMADLTIQPAVPLAVNVLPVAAGTYLSSEDIARVRVGEPLQLPPAGPPVEVPAGPPVEVPAESPSTVVTFPGRPLEPEPEPLELEPGPEPPAAA